MLNRSITALAQAWEQALPAIGYQLLKGKKAESVRTLNNALSMATAALEEVMPWECRQNQTGTLHISTTASGALRAQWETTQDTYDLKGLIANRLELAGALPGIVEPLSGSKQSALPEALLTDLVVDALTRKKAVLPGFRVAEAQEGKAATLVWQPSVTRI